MEEKQEKEPPSVALSGERLNEFYKARSVELTQSLIDAFSTSQETRGIPSGEGGRQFWASVLFARICGFGSAMHSLMPETPANKLGAIYDFAPIATICRSLFEAYIAFKYLCEPALSMNEYLLRLHGMQLHDCTRRPDILTKITGDRSDDRFSEQANELIEKIKRNPMYVGKSVAQQKSLLSGKAAYYLNQEEILENEAKASAQSRGMYEFLSAHTHSFPFSFIRAHLHEGRGTGRENDYDKLYIAMAAEIGAPILMSSIKIMKNLFPEIKKFRRYKINWDAGIFTPPNDDDFVFGITKGK